MVTKKDRDDYETGRRHRNADTIFQVSHDASNNHPDSEAYYKGRRGEQLDDDADESSGGGGCFISTACIRARGLPDDCRELQSLRAFRDGYVTSLPEGPALLVEYYRFAPQVVSAINERPDASSVYEHLYHTLVVPSVRLIDTGQEARALDYLVAECRNLMRDHLTSVAT